MMYHRFQVFFSFSILFLYSSSDALEAVALPTCSVAFSSFTVEKGLAQQDPEKFSHRAAHFFNSVTTEMIERTLGDTPPGEAMHADSLFNSQDARWRLLRPVPSKNDPDALVIAPQQTQYLVRPTNGSPYEALVLVGLDGENAVERPALAGRMAASDGQIFTIEPVDPTACPVDPGAAAAWADAVVEEHTASKSE
mgnify:CR=1 FL=1